MLAERTPYLTVGTPSLIGGTHSLIGGTPSLTVETPSQNEDHPGTFMTPEKALTTDEIRMRTTEPVICTALTLIEDQRMTRIMTGKRYFLLDRFSTVIHDYWPVLVFLY